MRPSLAALALAFAAFGTAVAAPPRPLAANHPFIGTWTFRLPNDGCVETFVIRPDGTTLITSGDEEIETQVDVSDRPDARGAYRWDDRVVKGNGKHDCGDAVTPVGRSGTNWLRFDATGDRMALCQDAALRECIGPYRKSRGTSAGSTKL